MPLWSLYGDASEQHSLRCGRTGECLSRIWTNILLFQRHASMEPFGDPSATERRPHEPSLMRYRPGPGCRWPFPPLPRRPFSYEPLRLTIRCSARHLLSQILPTVGPIPRLRSLCLSYRCDRHASSFWGKAFFKHRRKKGRALNKGVRPFASFWCPERGLNSYSLAAQGF